MPEHNPDPTQEPIAELLRRTFAKKEPPMPAQTPSLGRIVIVKTYRNGDLLATEVGLVTFVWGPEIVNLAVFQNQGGSFDAQSVDYLDENAPIEGVSGLRWSWPPRV